MMSWALKRMGFAVAVFALALSPAFASSSTKAKFKRKNKTSVRTSFDMAPQTLSAMDTQVVSTEIHRKSTTDAQWRLGLKGLSYASQNREENTQLAELQLGGKLELHLLESLDFNARAGVVMGTGQAQTRFGENVPENRVALEEAALNFHPLEVLTFRAGALDQATLDMPLLVSQRPFPGVSEGIAFNIQNAGFKIFAQQLVPTSVTMTTKTEGNEKQPTFMTETAKVELKNISMFDFAANATLFQFKDLPSEVANASELGGNTVFATSPVTSRFAYEFSGWTTGASARANISRNLSFTVGGQILQNTKAPEGFKNGQLAYLESNFYVKNGVSLRPRGEIFFSESDSAPAYYNEGEYFHNNHKGFAAGLDANFDKQKFKLGARFVDGTLLSESLQQPPHEQLLILRFETMYADF